MLNHAIAQLRQIVVTNISQVSSSHTSHANAARKDVELDQRPSTLRRRSTRFATLAESSILRLQRFESAISKHHFESFLVAYDGRELIYVSECQYGSSPAFLPFAIDSHSHAMDVVLYTRLPDQPWHVQLRQQVQLGQLVPLTLLHESAERNQLRFCLDEDSWYCLPAIDAVPEEFCTVPAKAKSYSFNQVMRLQSLTEFINDGLQSIGSLKDEMSTLLKEADESIKRLQLLDITRTRLTEVSESCKKQRSKTVAERGKIERLRDSNALRRSLLHSSRAQMQSTRHDLLEAEAHLEKRRPAIDLLSSEIRRLQRQLTTTLSQIYPITTTANTSRIRGLKTAQNSDYWMQNHEEAAALGYIAHFVFLLSHYLAIPLRYPVRPVGSHSSIVDPISVMSEDVHLPGGPPYSAKQDRRFPLYFQRGEVERMQWGVFLLNKDIQQLLQGRGLVCGDLRHSLPNLAALVIWLVSVNEEEDASLSASVDPPILVRNTVTSLQRPDGRDQPPEITDHEDLVAAQLRSTLKGKGKLTNISEKDEGNDWEEDAMHQLVAS